MRVNAIQKHFILQIMFFPKMSKNKDLVAMQANDNDITSFRFN